MSETTSTEGTRRSTRPKPGRPAVLGIMVVALTAGMLTIAGTTPRGIGRPVEDPSQVSLDQRVFSCTGGITGTRTVTGDVANGLAPSRKLTSTPVRTTAAEKVADSSFAGQQAKFSGQLAWVPCPEPRASWWFVGAGGGVIHNTVLRISNPRTGAAVVDIDVFGKFGPVEAPGLRGITVPPGETRSIDIGETAPATDNLAVRVVAKRGLVAASAADSFNVNVVGTKAFEWLPAQSTPSTATTLTGLPPKADVASLMVVNPGTVEAIAEIRIIGKTGTFSPRKFKPFTIAPHSVATLPVKSVLDGSSLAIRVVSERRLTATIRTVVANDTAYATGALVVRSESAFAVPEGKGRLVLSSLKLPADVKLYAYDAKGRSLFAKTVKVPAQASASVELSGKVRYVRMLPAKSGVIAGFAMSSSRGTAGGGVAPASRSIRLPQVRAGW